MCYAKPGPRCSASARKAYIQAATFHRTLNLSRKFGDEETFEAKENLRIAEEEWLLTPDGLRDLQRRIDRGEDNDGYLAVQKEHFTQKRKDALKAIGVKNASDKHEKRTPVHRSTADKFTSPDFQADDASRKSWDFENRIELEKAYIEDSAAWTQTLSIEERTAVRWFTSNGMVASYKMRVLSEKGTKKDQILQGHLDAAFTKYKNKAPSVVYRGIQSHEVPDSVTEGIHNYDEKSKVQQGYIASSYTVGSTVEIPQYMSATVDPDKAIQFAGQDVVLEIKTASSAPVGMYSAWGVSEREMLVEGGHSYKVVGVKKDVKFTRERPNGEERVFDFTVVQLEEIPKPRTTAKTANSKPPVRRSPRKTAPKKTLQSV